MLIKGEKLSGRNVEVCVIPRGNGENIVFKCQSVLDMDDFEKLCPSPQVPIRILPGNKKVQDTEDPLYKGLMALHSEKRILYLILKSLEATEDLEWETVKMSDSNTWEKYTDELKESGFSHIEIMRIINTTMAANCLDESRVQEARDAFLALQQAQLEKLSTPKVEQ